MWEVKAIIKVNGHEVSTVFSRSFNAFAAFGECQKEVTRRLGELKENELWNCTVETIVEKF
jgi:hypothetical protein